MSVTCKKNWQEYKWHVKKTPFPLIVLGQWKTFHVCKMYMVPILCVPSVGSCTWHLNNIKNWMIVQAAHLWDVSWSKTLNVQSSCLCHSQACQNVLRMFMSKMLPPTDIFKKLTFAKNAIKMGNSHWARFWAHWRPCVVKSFLAF